jgi:hypothetical protein
MSKFARIKPYQPSEGNVLIDWTSPWGRKYKAGDWHEVNDETAEYMRQVPMQVAVRNSKPAFDICDTEADANALIQRERMDRLQRVRNTEVLAPKPPTSVESRKATGLNAQPLEHELERKAAEMALAAEAAPAPAPVPAKPKSRKAKPDLSGKTVKELRAMAKKVGVANASRMTKAKLIAALKG